MIDDGIAALSHGQGWTPEPDYPDEEQIDEGLRRMPPHLSRVVIANYTSWAVQEVKVKALNLMAKKMQRKLKRRSQIKPRRPFGEQLQKMVLASPENQLISIRQYRDYLSMGKVWLLAWLEKDVA